LNDPFSRVELVDGAEDIEEDLLYRILGFGVVAQNAPGDREEKRAVALE
jgi:hypothetical protein